MSFLTLRVEQVNSNGKARKGMFNRRMETMKNLTMTLIVTVLALGATRAGDAASLELTGFSRDGFYLAFEQFGEQDGSGFAYSSVSVVRVDQNKLVFNDAFTAPNETLSLQRARNAARAKANASLKRYGIVGGNQGRFWGAAPKLGDRLEGYQSANFEALGNAYELELTAVDESAPPKDICVVKPQLLTLKLNLAQQSRVLQRDARLPGSRQCAYDYEMRSAHVYGRSLAVFVTYKTTGFEGPDVRWIVVTARL
jgi:predicted secreted protein